MKLTDKSSNSRVLMVEALKLAKCAIEELGDEIPEENYQVYTKLFNNGGLAYEALMKIDEALSLS